MDDLNTHVKTVLRASLFLLSAAFLTWAIWPGARPLASGFAIGMVVSMINSYYLGMKIRQMTILVMSKESKRFNLGFLTRAAMAVLTVILVSRVEGINLYATIAGLFTVQALALAVGFASLLRKKR